MGEMDVVIVQSGGVPSPGLCITRFQATKQNGPSAAFLWLSHWASGLNM